MEAGMVKRHQSDIPFGGGKPGFSEEINIVVFKDTSRQNLSNQERKCFSLKKKVQDDGGNENETSQICKWNPQMFSCDKCDYEGTKTNLAVHRLRRHNKEYKCSKCEYQSVTEGGVERHERIFHSTEDVRAYACGVCSYRGVTRKQLHEHAKYQHREGAAKHLCPMCEKKFKTQVQWKHHLISHSLLRLYSCKGCSYRAKHRQSLHLHIRHSHPGSEARALAQGPSDSDFEALIQSASSVNASPRWAKSLKRDASVSDEDGSTLGDDDGLPPTASLLGGGVDNLLIFPLENVMSFCEDAGASGVVAMGSLCAAPLGPAPPLSAHGINS